MPIATVPSPATVPPEFTVNAASAVLIVPLISRVPALPTVTVPCSSKRPICCTVSPSEMVIEPPSSCTRSAGFAPSAVVACRVNVPPGASASSVPSKPDVPTLESMANGSVLLLSMVTKLPSVASTSSRSAGASAALDPRVIASPSKPPGCGSSVPFMMTVPAVTRMPSPITGTTSPSQLVGST